MAVSGTTLLRGCFLAVIWMVIGSAAHAQDEPRFYRIHLRDKGTPERFLLPGDSSYQAAVAHLSERALKRRAKVLPTERLVSTDDLPLFAPYLDQIRATGATIAQSSRWLNTVMVRVDSATLLRVTTLPFLDSVVQMRAPVAPPPYSGKRVTSPMNPADSALLAFPLSQSTYCIVDHYGRSDRQNRMVQYDVANRLGIAGEDVIIAVCDAGFDWRAHVAFRQLDVKGEYDFVNGDSVTFDQPDEESPGAETHGTMVLSLMTAYWPDTVVGAAFRSGVLLAKTEDIRSERHVEEDHLVAGLEWLEAAGGDVVNISLGYTRFDSPEREHAYSELDGHTAFGSRGINHLVSLGVVAVVAAGNDGFGEQNYHYVGVPGEADSAIAAAAVDSEEKIALFSSRGFGSPGEGGRVRIKPDLAALGVGNFAAVPSSPNGLVSQQGTSFASPVTATAVALLLSAAPELRPWEVRSLLQSTASRGSSPDTAFGYGVVRLGDALEKLSTTRPIVGFPVLRRSAQTYETLIIAAGVLYSPASRTEPLTDGEIDSLTYLGLRCRSLKSAAKFDVTGPQPTSGIARWFVPGMYLEYFKDTDWIEIEIYSLADNKVLRTARLAMNGSSADPHGSLCGEVFSASSTLGTASPNPFSSSTVIEYMLQHQTRVTLVVYNSIGQEVGVLIDDERRDVGYHSEIFNAVGLPAGAYYYRLSSGLVTQTGSLIHIP